MMWPFRRRDRDLDDEIRCSSRDGRARCARARRLRRRCARGRAQGFRQHSPCERDRRLARRLASPGTDRPRHRARGQARAARARTVRVGDRDGGRRRWIDDRALQPARCARASARAVSRSRSADNRAVENGPHDSWAGLARRVSRLAGHSRVRRRRGLQRRHHGHWRRGSGDRDGRRLRVTGPRRHARRASDPRPHAHAR